MNAKLKSIKLALAGLFICSAFSVRGSDNLGALNDLWNVIKSGQSQDRNDALTGAWKEDIAVRGEAAALFSDMSPFSALQIMLRLEGNRALATHPDFVAIKTRFQPFVDYYLNHRLEHEPFGAIGFWPVWTLEDNTLIRAPSPDKRIREFSGDHLPADTDDSSQMATWLLKTDPHHPFIQAYLKLLETVTDVNRSQQDERESSWKTPNSGAFMTWIGIPSKDNNVDCVVNINILTSLSLAKKMLPLSPTLLEAERKTSSLILNVLRDSKVPQCSYYYSRWSQVFLALGKLYEADKNHFAEGDWENIRLQLKEKLEQQWRRQSQTTLTTLDWAEYLVAAKMLGVPAASDLQETLRSISSYLWQKVRTNSYHEILEGNDVFRGEIANGMTLLWYVQAQTAATLLEALY